MALIILVLSLGAYHQIFTLHMLAVSRTLFREVDHCYMHLQNYMYSITSEHPEVMWKYKKEQPIPCYYKIEAWYLHFE